MRRLVALVLCWLPATAMADRPMWGGAGFMSQGWYLGDVSGIGADLGVEAPSMGLQVGGGGFALLAGRLVLGGGGYGLLGLNGDGLDAETDFGGGGGGFTIGGAVINDGTLLITPYVGGVGHGARVVVENGPNAGRIGGVSMDPGERRAFGGGGWAIDVGASVFHLMWDEDGGGLVVGGSVGGWIPVGGSDWELDGGGVAKGVSGTPGGLYFRVDVGGGGALHK